MLDVVVTNKAIIGKTLKEVPRPSKAAPARGIFLRKLIRGGQEMPFIPNTKIERGDVVQIVGPAREVERAASAIGYADRATDKTDMLFMGLGVVWGAGRTLTIHLGGVPLSLSCSGARSWPGWSAAGCARSIGRSRIPEPALVVFNNLDRMSSSRSWASAPARRSSPD
jgi:putative transport protein